MVDREKAAERLELRDSRGVESSGIWSFESGCQLFKFNGKKD